VITTIVVSLIVLAAAVFAYVTASVNAEADREDVIVSVPPVANDVRAFMRALAGAVGDGVRDGNQIVVFQNGVEIFPALLDAIAGASDSIHFSTFVYWTGTIPTKFAAAFAAASQRGVTVRIILDRSGSKKASPELIDLMRRAGCEVRWFRRIHWFDWARYNHRNHRKLLVVDGETAFTGGVGIADEWDGDGDSPTHWRDSHVRILGPAVATVQSAFVDNWNEATGELPVGENHFPELRPAGDIAVCSVQSNPVNATSAAQRSMAVLIAGATHRLWITNAYFVPSPPFLQALRAAKSRGVDVKILVPGRYHNQPAVRRASRHTWRPLLDGNIELYEYERTMIHAKIVVVDGAVTSIGSINFDPRSFALNAEFGIVALDAGVAGQMEKAFVADLRFARRVTVADVDHLSARDKLLDAIYYWVRAQL
jgi:cardiolipin synthase